MNVKRRQQKQQIEIEESGGGFTREATLKQAPSED